MTPKASSVQIISPSQGETRKLPPPSSPPSAAAASERGDVGQTSSIGLEEERDQAEDERVEGDRLGQREAEPADRLQLVLHLGLAGDGLDLLAEDDADADAGADRAEAGADTEGDRLAGVGDAGRQ